MSAIDTLAELQKRVKDASSGGGGNRKKFLTLKDTESKRIRFLQELVKDAENYTEARGVGKVVGVHKNPLNFKRTVACVKNNEEFGYNCWACTQVELNNKYKAQDHLIINIAVLQPDAETWEHMIVDQSFNQRHIGGTVVEYAAEYGTIVDRTYKFGRQGSGLSNTNYSLIPVKEEKEPKEFADFEMVDCDSLYRRLGFDEQKEYLLKSDEEVQAAKDPSASW